MGQAPRSGLQKAPFLGNFSIKKQSPSTIVKGHNVIFLSSSATKISSPIAHCRPLGPPNRGLRESANSNKELTVFELDDTAWLEIGVASQSPPSAPNRAITDPKGRAIVSRVAFQHNNLGIRQLSCWILFERCKTAVLLLLNYSYYSTPHYHLSIPPNHSTFASNIAISKSIRLAKISLNILFRSEIDKYLSGPPGGLPAFNHR